MLRKKILKYNPLAVKALSILLYSS